tara:strand:- start:2619 stop:5975 length:3357 start_codon:yes stop_codon:yes gene_type:complete
MSNPTKSYYIDINRFSAQDNESDQTNIWDYNLNDTIVAPMGSEVSVHQAFINQKGITGQSIEFEEDLTESVYYYAYVSEMEHPCPVVQDPLETKRGSKHDMNDQYWGYLDLLNNAASGVTEGRGKGRTGLWGIQGNITEGTYQHLDSLKYGGCGVPLILSTPPVPDTTTEWSIQVSITPPKSVGYPAATIQVADGSNAFIITNWSDVVNGGLLRNIGGGGTGILTDRLDGDTTTPAVFDDKLILNSVNADGTGNFVVGYSGIGGTYTVKLLNSTAFQVGQMGPLSYSIPVGREVKVGQRVYDKLGNVPLGLKVSATDFQGNGGFRVENDAGQIVSLGTEAKNNIYVFLNDDTDYYISPQPLLATITVPKGIYGIQQLVSLINNQLNGLGNPNSKVPNKPYDVGLIGGDYNGMINQGTQGFTTTISPMEYRDAPDSIHLSEIDPKLRTILGQSIPDHTLISAFDYAENWISRQAINKKNRADFTTKIAGNGYVGYMMDNNIEGCQQDGLTLQIIPPAYNINGNQMFDIEPIANCINGGLEPANTNQGCKARSDYLIGGFDKKSMTVGAPEANIQYDTDTSAFSLNNLHSSWRLPTHDILGSPITNKGEVGVGIKRCAEICDAQPYSQFQTIWGSASRANLTTDHTNDAIMEARPVPNTNIMDSIRFRNLDNDATFTRQALMSFMTIGAKIEPVNATPHGDSSDRLPASSSHGDIPCEILEITPAATKQSTYSGSGGSYPSANSDEFFSIRITFPDSFNGGKQVFGSGTDLVYFTVQGQMSGTTTEQKQMISSFQRPKSRTGGVIVYNFSQSVAMKYSDRPEVTSDAEYSLHASFRDFFSSRSIAKKIWKNKTLWGKLGFSYEQFNDDAYYENIVQYCKTTNLKLRGITSDTVLDVSSIPTISTQINPSNYTPSSIYNANTDKVTGVQVFNNFDVNSPRTELQKNYGGSDQMPMPGTNQLSYSGSIHTHTTMTNIVAKPTPISAEELPTLSKFGYYLITSDLVPTYKDIVSKGDPLGLLGVVPKTSLSSQDFIPLANSDITQVLNQDTIINNVRVKILNPDLSNPTLSENSSVIIRIDVPIEPPQQNSEEETKKPKKKCPKTGHKICKCPPTSIEKISKK